MLDLSEFFVLDLTVKDNDRRTVIQLANTDVVDLIKKKLPVLLQQEKKI